MVMRPDPRENMLNSQILTGHVLANNIIDAINAVAREKFIPDALKGVAYIDEEIPLGQGRFLIEPLVFARLLNQADIQNSEVVLDVASGTGYGAAVLSHLARKVVAVEDNAELAAKSKSLLAGYSNVMLAFAPLIKGASKEGPYDVILIEGGIQFLPQALGDQLREGGRIVAVEHHADAKIAALGLGKLVEYRKLRGQLFKTVLQDASVGLLCAFAKPVLFAL